MENLLPPALTARSLYSDIRKWMLDPPVEGASSEDWFVARISRYLQGIFETPLEKAITSQLSAIQLGRARAFCAQNRVSLLEAIMTLPMITKEQFDECKGQRVLLHRRGYVEMRDINEALFEGFLFEVRNRLMCRSEEERLLSSPMLTAHQRKALLLTLVNPDWPLPR